ncbi:MAG: 5'/3'-nucleotidase SurE [Gordonia sp. (in: high G+C Gram-positive bacteria)]
MRVLVTNDDGVDAAGIVDLSAALLDDGHEVIVAAPSTERSGSGSSIGTIADGSQIPLQQKRIDALGATPVFAADCPPAMVVIAACAGAFGAPPDIVASGINPGHNTGRSILFSSTVGAVLAARVAGVGGLAISTGFEPHHRYDTAAAVARRLVTWMAEDTNRRLTLNVNVPAVDFTELRGVSITTLAAQSMFSLKVSRVGDALALRREERGRGFAAGTDGDAVASGRVSVTSLSPVTDGNGALSADATRTLVGALDLAPTS